MAVVAGAVCALLMGFVTGYFCGRKCHKDEDDNLPYPDTEYEYFEQRQNVNRIQTEPKLLPQVEEVTYAEPVLMPQPPPKGPPSPRNTLRKPSLRDPCEPREPRDARNLPPGNADILFQYQTDGGYNARDYRARDNFGTLRSHQGDQYRRGEGFSTTRSVKKVYL
uniref:Putative secreted protein n=1 Tax=Xenopsylla cheopis TaxID=163159 RepID=A0A6M2DWI8_XENCH